VHFLLNFWKYSKSLFSQYDKAGKNRKGEREIPHNNKERLLVEFLSNLYHWEKVK
jgi:hypothetical protein